MNKARNNGVTPLIVASHQNHLGIVRLLLENGAQTDNFTNRGFTALSQAKKKGNNEIVKLLIKHGAKK